MRDNIYHEFLQSFVPFIYECLRSLLFAKKENFFESFFQISIQNTLILEEIFYEILLYLLQYPLQI